MLLLGGKSDLPPNMHVMGWKRRLGGVLVGDRLGSWVDLGGLYWENALF